MNHCCSAHLMLLAVKPWMRVLLLLLLLLRREAERAERCWPALHAMSPASMCVLKSCVLFSKACSCTAGWADWQSSQQTCPDASASATVTPSGFHIHTSAPARQCTCTSTATACSVWPAPAVACNPTSHPSWPCPASALRGSRQSTAHPRPNHTLATTPPLPARLPYSRRTGHTAHLVGLGGRLRKVAHEPGGKHAPQELHGRWAAVGPQSNQLSGQQRTRPFLPPSLHQSLDLGCWNYQGTRPAQHLYRLHSC